MKRFGCVKSFSGETRGWNVHDLIFWHVRNNIKSDRLPLSHGRLRIFANQTKRVQELPNRWEEKALYFEDDLSSAWSCLQSQHCGNTGVTWVKKRGQINGPPKLGNWWSYKSPQIWPRCIAVPENVPTYYMMHISPIPHHTSQDHEALPLRMFANKIKRRQKGGSLKTFIYRKPTSPICMRISRER